MTFKPLTYFLLLGSVALSFSGMAKDNKPNIPVVTDEAELRDITDTYRGPPEREKDFIPQGDGTVIDKRTGLQWMRCALGQKWAGETCEGEPYGYTWKQANKERSDFAGYSDWRLPSMWELETLVYCSNGKFMPRGKKYKELNYCQGDYQRPTLIKKVFPDSPTTLEGGFYWSSLRHLGSEYDAWGVHFYDGYSSSADMSDSLPVRLVRSGQ